MANLQRADFDVGKLVRELVEKERRTGGVVTFLGTAREFSKGRNILHLEFESYAGMAIATLDRLEREAVSNFGILHCRIVHRTGKIGIGENIVLVIVTAMHRKDAFTACEWAIDELKKRVPIWKKEFTDNGEEWVEQHP